MNSTNRKSPQATQSVERPVVPPVYHAPPPLKAVQPIVANGAANRRPAVAPSVYRPQPVPKVLQQKRSSPGRPVARAPHLPVAPPVYRPEAGKTVQPKAISPLRTPTAANVVQRSVDDDWDMSYSSEDIDSEDQEILLATSPNVLQWRNGVAAGYREGWDEGVDDERQQLPFFQQPTLVQALAMVGPIPGGAIPAAQIVPPGTWVLPGDERDDGISHGHALGYQAGAAVAFRVLAWARANYPAIPWASQVVALAQNGGICVYCNVAVSTQVDHVYPVQKHWVTLGYQGANLGQVNDASNLVGSCQPCNLAKSNLYLNNWQPPSWVAGQWFPHGPPAGTIPPRRGGPIALGNW